MKTWPAPTVPPIPPSGIMPSFFDTRRQQVRELPLRTDGVATVYVCGITPYDSTHMGHAMTYHAADLMRRVLLDAGVQVRFAENVTDVDDPLFERAARDGIAWQDLAAREVQRFSADMTALRILPPDHFQSVSEAMAEIVRTVNELLERGVLYPVPNEVGTNDWYQEYALTGGSGIVEQMDPARARELFAERGGDPERAGKKNPLDPLVWRAERDGEPAWDGGALGPGRPGWHVECAVIADSELGGLPIDLQIGGSDLIFPHHEMGHVHALGLGHSDFATLWAHAGMVAYQGTKMSKSLGNLVFISRLRDDGVEPAAIRLALLSHHYRSDWEWTPKVLTEAQERLAGYRRALADLPVDAATADAIRAAIRNDLDTPSALAALDQWAARARAGADAGSAMSLSAEKSGVRIADLVDALLGVQL